MRFVCSHPNRTAVEAACRALNDTPRVPYCTKDQFTLAVGLAAGTWSILRWTMRANGSWASVGYQRFQVA